MHPFFLCYSEFMQKSIFSVRLPLLPLAAVACLMLAACKPSEPPPDIIKPQRQAMEKARAVGDVMQNGVNNADRKIDEESK